MKRFLVSATMLALLSVPALAAKNSQIVNLPETLKAGSTQLAPGDYEVTWTGTGENAQVTFARNRKILASVPAKIVVQNNKLEGLDTDTEGGVATLQVIRLKNMNLVLEGSSSAEK
jgi:hypothetical protein